MHCYNTFWNWRSNTHQVATHESFEFSFFQVSVKIELWMPLSIKQNIIQINHNISLKINNFTFKVNKKQLYVFMTHIVFFILFKSLTIFYLLLLFKSSVFGRNQRISWGSYKINLFCFCDRWSQTLVRI